MLTINGPQQVVTVSNTALFMTYRYALLWHIYKDNPRLAVKDLKQHLPGCVADAEHCTCPERAPSQVNSSKSCSACCHDWLMYFRHPMRMAGIGLALVYMTVIGLDAVTTGTDFLLSAHAR
jgi:iron-regulated transporter 1